MSGGNGSARCCRSAPHDLRAGRIGADTETTREIRACAVFVLLLLPLSSVGSEGECSPTDSRCFREFSENRPT
jgi:hypothetical protein